MHNLNYFSPRMVASAKMPLKKIEKQEKDLEANLTELHKAQDALRKLL